MNLIGYFHGQDPAACLIQDGRLVAFVEEERLLRFKHAPGVFPIRSIVSCLELGGIDLGDVDAFVYGWDAPRYADGGMTEFYDSVNEAHPPDAGTLAWQQACLARFRPEALRARLEKELVRQFGLAAGSDPTLRFFPHHESHAAAAFYLSPFDEALVLTVDGSGDSDCTTLWRGHGTELELLCRIPIPHSLGWFYAALTEYLGFRAYDGEYKVMGLAAYGRPSPDLRQRLDEVLRPGPQGFDYELDPAYIHHGAHSFSERYTDQLADLMPLPPRLGGAPIEPIHEDLAFETQRALEEHALRLVTHFRDQTGLKNLCIGGGVGLNVKMNSRIHQADLFEGLFPFPIPSDSGLGIGAALGLWLAETGRRPEPLRHLYLGPSFADEEIEAQIRASGLAYRRCDDVAAATAELLDAGKIVGWFQGPMEGGPRSLGGRSILADPRLPASRDRVNSAIKFREYWRPFCPSIAVGEVTRLLRRGEPAPYMILAFEATDAARDRIRGTVHVDGTVRVQTVDPDSHPLYYRLLERFEERTGVAAVLNTSFNIKGEAIVCSPRDAFRTFWSTGLDALAIGPFVIEKPVPPVPEEPEEVVR